VWLCLKGFLVGRQADTQAFDVFPDAWIQQHLVVLLAPVAQAAAVVKQFGVAIRQNSYAGWVAISSRLNSEFNPILLAVERADLLIRTGREMDLNFFSWISPGSFQPEIWLRSRLRQSGNCFSCDPTRNTVPLGEG
jgi:hypothetical protein